MRTTLLILTCVGGAALADDRAPMKNGTYNDRDKAWTKFAILGVKLGGALEKHPGFTCGPPPGTGGFSTQNHSCVKFVDDRCKDRPTKIHNITSSADVPAGQSCFMDEFTGDTFLDRKHVVPPLQAVRIVGTNTSAPLVFQLEYTFAADDLTAGSNLGKALIGKYGPPASDTPPVRMTWRVGDVELRAACRTIAGEHAPQGEFCKIVVEDNKLDDVERGIQQQANDDARQHSAPPPPPL